MVSVKAVVTSGKKRTTGFRSNMGLDELLSDDDVHPKSVKATNEKLHNEDMCPSCGSTDTRDGPTFNYCDNDDCDVFSFKHPTYKVELDKIWD